MSVTDTIYVKRAVTDYIIAALKANRALDDVKLFVRGGLPPGMVPQDRYPFVEVMIAQETEDEEYTGNYYSQHYDGLLTVTVLSTQYARGDWLEHTGNRVATVSSYDQVEELVAHVVAELQKSEHKDMGELSVRDEVVTGFTVTGPRVFGIDHDSRTNSWENFGSIPFSVATQRRRE